MHLLEFPLYSPLIRGTLLGVIACRWLLSRSAFQPNGPFSFSRRDIDRCAAP